jgi:hypothetical protein
MPRLLSQLAVAAATIHSVLGESFSIPLAKQSAPGPVRLPPRSYNDYITGQVPEVNQEVRGPTLGFLNLFFNLLFRTTS